MGGFKGTDAVGTWVCLAIDMGRITDIWKGKQHCSGRAMGRVRAIGRFTDTHR